MKSRYSESLTNGKEIAMTNRHRAEATIASDKRAFETCPSRRAHRFRRRASGPAGIFEERKA